ncbi:(2Fe-2S)-binding protein [Luminiphilus sp.]|nr:(2Fe-2S)-binding protein [Luminiphilus sp.]MDA9721715.1 (2Fe-2S)-binding protein [Luminiphilus sp.]
MYICICKGVTEQAIREEVCAGARSVDEVSRNTGCSTQCGKCLLRAQRVFEDARLASSAATSGTAAVASASS